MVIYDTLSAAKFDSGNGDWMTEAGELGKELQASRTLISHRAKDSPLRLINVIDTEVHLGKGTAMAELLPVEVLGQPTCPDVNRAQGERIEELMDGFDAGVTGAEGDQLRKLLQEFGGILSVNEYDMGQTGSRNIGLMLKLISQFGSR